MTDTIKALIVDDSATFRSALKLAIRKHDDLEVMAGVANGQQAIDQLKTRVPDVVLMDIIMPEMTGLEALELIRKDHPALPVVMISGRSEEHEDIQKAFKLGADEFLIKPDPGHTSSKDWLTNEVIPTIRRVGEGNHRRARRPVKPGEAKPDSGPNPAVARAPSEAKSGTVELPDSIFSDVKVTCLGIGVSTGGPVALESVIPALPANFPVPILLVQHMPPKFTAALAERLDEISAVKVVEAQDGDDVLPGTVYIAPGDFHMEVIQNGPRRNIRLNQDPQENGCRPAVDPLFRSLEKIYGRNLLAVVMTGMGQDGAKSCGSIKERSGRVLVQDKDTSAVWGMPGAVFKAGHADVVLPLRQIPDAICKLIEIGRGG